MTTSVRLLDPKLGLNARERNLIAAIRARRLTYLSSARLASIARCCREIEEKKLPGMCIEVGCALGGSSVLIASLKGAGRELFLYDVFAMIPAPGPEDPPDVHERYRTIATGRATGIDGDRYYGYEQNLFEIVTENLRSFGVASGEGEQVKLVQGLVQDTMTIAEPVAFAHVDVDWFDPVLTCLERIFPHLVVGGSMILDDYNDWGGCRKAANQYLAQIPDQYIADDSAGSLKITRTSLAEPDMGR